MAIDINYNPEQNDSFSPEPEITYWWWCEKCLNYHIGPYSCPYEDFDYCPHCGQLMRVRRQT